MKIELNLGKASNSVYLTSVTYGKFAKDAAGYLYVALPNGNNDSIWHCITDDGRVYPIGSSSATTVTVLPKGSTITLTSEL